MFGGLNGKGTGDIGVRQQTLTSSINCSGTGLHSGSHVSMTMHPAAPGTGIVFRRNGHAGDPSIPALLGNVIASRLCTTLGNDNGASVGTVEHLMAALAGCNVDNAIIEVEGPEVPIMDGSAAPFVFLVESAGLEVQDAPRRALQIRRTVSVGDSSRTAVLAPAAGSSVSFEIDFGDHVIARQEYFVTLANGTFRSEISRARTFGFDHEVASLRSMGFARGGSLENAIVVSENGVLNDDGLRYEDEFVRHKVLDCIGDLYLTGAPVIGHFHGYRSGHSLTHTLLRTILADPDAWRMTTFDDLEPVSPSPAGDADEVLAATA